MSMLGSQADRLRLTADAISERGVSSGDLAIIEIRLREAADTIESLSDKLQGVMGTRYNELFGTPERAAQLIADNCKYLDYCGRCLIRAANCDGEYSTVLEWLRGDA